MAEDRSYADILEEETLDPVISKLVQMYQVANDDFRRASREAIKYSEQVTLYGTRADTLAEAIKKLGGQIPDEDMEAEDGGHTGEGEAPAANGDSADA